MIFVELTWIKIKIILEDLSWIKIKITNKDNPGDLTSIWQPSGLAWGEEDSLGWSRATSYTLPFCSHLRGCISHMIRELLSEENSLGWSRATSYYTHLCLSVFIWLIWSGWSKATSSYTHLYLSVFIWPTWVHILCWWYVGFCHRKEGRIHWDYPHPLPSIVFLRQIQVDGFLKYLRFRYTFCLPMIQM